MRALFICALGFCALLLFSGRAHALDGDPPATAQSTTNDTALPPVTTEESSPPPTVPVAQPTPPTPAGAGGPDNTSTQDATVGTTGTGTANTGDNTAVGTAQSGDTADPPSTPPAPPTTVATTPTSGASAATGTSAATGDQSTSKIDQQVTASATDNATVEILQIALVVNVGVAHSTTGDNVAAAAAAANAGAGSSTRAVDRTGNALATGDNAHTGVVQGATVGSGESSSQTTTVMNIGIAISNTGINVTIASVGAGTAGGTAALASAPTTGTVTTGDASASGDRAASTIGQNASASASGNAVVTIDQRAIVVNFGIAISNTGGNFALASFDPSALTPEEQMIINALLGSLAPIIFGSQMTTPGSAVAVAATGSATGVGNTSTTTIAQTAHGTATGDSAASATQLAQVANLGLAVANSGFNGAFSGTPATSATPSATSAELTQAEQSLGAFFSLITNPDWLSSSNPFAAFAQTVEINGVTLDLGGSLNATDLFAGLGNVTMPTDATPGVHVVQISGVLNIGIATSDSGNNTVISVTTGTTSVDGPAFSSHVSAGEVTPTVRTLGQAALPAAPVPGTQTVIARVITGNATSVGNFAVITVCQSFHDSVCDPPVSVPVQPPHETPPPPPARPVASRSVTPVPVQSDPAVSLPTGEGTLPFTGANSSTLAGLGAALLAAGVALCRRRKGVSGGRRFFSSAD